MLRRVETMCHQAYFHLRDVVLQRETLDLSKIQLKIGSGMAPKDGWLRPRNATEPNLRDRASRELNTPAPWA
jgi:hypothetical protein